MSAKPKILCVCDPQHRDDAMLDTLREQHQLVEVSSIVRALARITRDQFAGVFVTGDRFREAIQVGRLLENDRILAGMPDAVVVLDSDNAIIWFNEKFRTWSPLTDIAGANFYAALGGPEIVGPDLCPLHSALATSSPSSSTLKASENKYFRIHVAPLRTPHEPLPHLIVTVRDVSAEVLQEQKMAAIHKAGVELANLTPAEVFQMRVADRIELLKSNIVHYTKDLFNFDVLEIRLLDPLSDQLEPLLAVGMTDEASERPLFKSPTGNGVTGYVAYTGVSYLCDDTAEDPLFIEGSAGAKSSLTVPLILSDQTIGTFNVESPLPRAFTEIDRKFLEIFSRDIAVALNTLELLVAQGANTAQESVEAIHQAVAIPVDEILNDAVNVMEQFIGHDPDVSLRLQRILRNARDIKQVIQKVGQQMTPVEAVPAAIKKSPERPKLLGKRVLVADADNTVRAAAHQLLERYGCVVETAHTGSEALCMIRNSFVDASYDVIIADVRLSDLNGFTLYTKLKEIMDPVPLVLMTGYGYDPGHSIVHSRQAGLPAHAVLYKPFRLDQLLNTVEATIELRANVVQQA